MKAAAAIPLKETAVASARLVPVMLTTVPTGPDVGVKLVTATGRVTDTYAVLVSMSLSVGLLTVRVTS